MGISRLFITAFIPLILCQSTCCLMADANDDVKINEFVDVLKEIGKRKNFELTKDVVKDDIIKIGSRIALLDRPHARMVIAKYFAYLEDAEMDEQMNGYMTIYIVNRIYFAVPEWVPASEFRPFGGFAWTRHDKGKVNIRFPLSVSPGGNMKIEPGNMSYMGPPYQGVAEFDFFSSKYSPRSNQK